MNAPSWVEIVGYIASILVAVSLTMSSIVRLRIINLVGAIAFTVYGVLIDAWPVAAVNAFIIVINLFYLRRLSRTREYFHLLEVDSRSEYLHHFLDFHADDIRQTHPGFGHVPAPDTLNVFILRDTVPAGLFLGHLVEPGVMSADLDFAVPRYRDYKMGRFLFEQRPEIFRSRGVGRIVTDPGDAEHQAYLRRMGFREEGGVWSRAVA